MLDDIKKCLHQVMDNLLSEGCKTESIILLEEALADLYEFENKVFDTVKIADVPDLD